MSLTDNPPPQDLEAERCVLGSALADPSCIDEVSTLLTEDQFYADANRKLWSTIVTMHDAGVGLDAVTVAKQLASDGRLEEIGGPVYILTVMQSVPHAAHAIYYARLVREKHLRRLAMEHGTGLQRAALDETLNQEEVLAHVEQHITQLIESRAAHSGPASLLTCLLESMERIESGKVLGTQTGYTDLDHMTTGMHAGQLIVLAARPSVGKSALAVNLSHAMAEHAPVLYASLEMSRVELAERLLSLESSVPLEVMRSGEMTPDQKEQVAMASNLLAHDRQIFIDDTPDLTVLRLASMARLHKRRHGIGLLIVDYLQVLTPADEKAPREQQISRMTRGLKCLAKSLGIPVLVLAQLNREIEKRQDKRPLLSDLRESGAIEQDADQVWMLHRPALSIEADDPNLSEAKGRAEIYVRKNRSGRTGMVTLQFTESTMRFRNFSGHSYSGMPMYPGSDF